VSTASDPSPGAMLWARGWPVLALVAFVLWTLRAPLQSFGDGLWGPENAWTNRDFLGAWWLFLSAGAEGTGSSLAKLSWPDGSLPIQHHIPNPFDGWLLGPLVSLEGFPAWWNGMQLGHHLGNIGAMLWLARVAGAGRLSSLAGAMLLASCPLMLHEISGGRTLSGVAWPGLCGLALLLRGKGLWAGLLIGIQGLCYVYTGLLFGLVALVLRPTRGLFSAALIMLPYLWWLSPVWSGLQGEAPPAGHSSVPLGGLLSGWWGSPQMPERFLFQPLLLAGLALPWMKGVSSRQSWKWVGCGALGLFIAMGPVLEWSKGDALLGSPMAWLLSGPELARMHHPVRAVLVAAPLLAVAVSLLLDRLPREAVWIPLIGALVCGEQMSKAVPWGVNADPPGLEAARWLQENGTAVVDLTGSGGPALGLAPVHGLPVLEGLRELRPAPNRVGPDLRLRADGWLRGERQPGLSQDLQTAGFSHVLAIDRGTGLDTTAIQSDLGPSVHPGVYALAP
jgi:hypothetical protein